LLLLLPLQSVINLPESILPNIPVPKGKTDVSGMMQLSWFNDVYNISRTAAACQPVSSLVPKGKADVSDS
jgi:hypothetical protein